MLFGFGFSFRGSGFRVLVRYQKLWGGSFRRPSMKDPATCLHGSLKFDVSFFFLLFVVL